ncbi:MAG TPA: glycosyltransferase [Candidatus Dojkabacteria bacterium]|nr:glycosyltransferase [Candidatus Dojkabacteria bacterium]
MKLSLVIPTYKKQREVLDQLERLYGFLTRKNPNFELIFVIDGYVDNTKEILKKYVKENRLKKITVIGYKENRGKGYAIRYGMKRAKGDVIGFIDADTDIQIRTLGYALKALKKDSVMAVIPSKLHKDSNVEMTLGRKIFSYGLIFVSKIFLNLPKNVNDVGCGLKLFRKELVERMLPHLTVDAFAIDSDMLHVIGKMGCKIAVTPFFLNKNRSESTATNIRETTKMLKDMFNIAMMDKVSPITSSMEVQYSIERKS